MTFDYFTKEQSDMFAFYRVPKILITSDYFEELSTNAKLLYGLLLDRVSLSSNNGWVDEQGHVYIIYTLGSIQRDMHCGDKKATRLLAELEKWNLIERIRQGQGKPSIIYVKNFLLPSEQRFLTGQNNDSRDAIITIQDSSKQRGNNTNNNYTDINYTNPIISGADVDNLDERQSYYEYLYDQLQMDYLYQQHPYEREILTEIFNLILDTVCSNRKQIRIAGDDKNINVVKSQFMKLDYSHIDYVLSCLKENGTDVRNIKQYLLASLYNAPLTISNYYQAMYNNDHANGLV